MNADAKPPVRSRWPVSNVGISSVLHRERRYMHAFFDKLADADIIFLADLEKYTAGELFRVAPTSRSNRERFMRYVRRGMLQLKASS